MAAAKLFDDYLQFSAGNPSVVVVKETASNNNELGFATNVPVTRTGIATASGTNVAFDGQQNVYLTGTYNSGTNVPIYNLTGSSAGFYLPSTTTTDSFIIKYDRFGIAGSWTKIPDSLASVAPTIVYNGLDSVYWTGSFKSTAVILNFNTANGTGTSSGMTIGLVATSTAYNTFMIKYDTNTGSARSFNLLTGLLDIVPTYSYMSGQNVYVSGYYKSSCNVYDFGTSYTILGPYTQLGSKLVGNGTAGTTAARQGSSVFMSSDGNTLAIGGPQDNTGAGATWVYTKSGIIWTQQGSKLVGNGTAGTVASQQGTSVALNSDGNTLAIGGQSDNTYEGAVWIFTRSGTTWTQQGSKLVGTGTVGTGRQGYSVSLSSDGNTLASGGYADNSDQGAVWIFTRSGTTWAQQGPKLVGTTPSTPGRQGFSVSLNSDGNTLALGGPFDTGLRGSIWIFTRSGTTWAQQGLKFEGSDYNISGFTVLIGWSVSLNSDGNTLAAGGKGDANSVGATWIFTRSGTTWTQQGLKLVGTGGIGSFVQQGYSVSLSSDGNTMASGGIGDNSNQGATWIFTRSGTTWTQKGTKLIVTDNTGAANQGYSVSFNSDASMLASGGYTDNTNAGATWMFNLPTILSPGQGNLPDTVSESGYLIRYQSDNFNSAAIIRGTGPSTAIVRPTCIVADNTYVYTSGYHNGTTSAFSFTGTGTIGSASTTFPFSSGTDRAFIARWLVQDGSIASSSSLTANNGSYFKSLSVIGPSLYASGSYNNSCSIFSFGTISNMALTGATSTANNPFIIKWAAGTGTASSFVTVPGFCGTSSAVSLVNDYNGSLYLSGSYTSAGTVQLNGFSTGGLTSTAMSMPISNGSVFMIKYVSDAPTTYNTINGATNGSFALNPLGTLYSTGSYTGTIGVTNFQASGSLYTVGTTGSYLASWTNDGQAVYQTYPLLRTVQEPIAANDVANKSYVDGSYEFLTVSGSGASVSPNVTTVLRPSEITITVPVAPIAYNSSPAGMAIDKVTGAVYLSGTYFGFTAPVYNKDGTYAFTLPPSLVGPSAFVLKYSSTGLAIGSTTIAGSRAGQLSLDNTGYIYCSGSYDSSVSVNIYDFSTSSVTGISRAIMPATGANAYIVRWSSTGMFDSYSCSQSYSQVNSLDVDGTGALYSPVNQPVSVIANFSNNSVVSGYTSFMQSTGTFSQQGPKLVGTGNTGLGEQGTSCSVYKNTIVEGAQGDNSNEGAVWVFTKSGTLWSQQGAKLVGTGDVGSARQGSSCSVYEDTIVSGGYTDNSNAGALWVFTRTGTTWTQLQSKLVGTGGVNPNQGTSCSVYKDTIASGGNGDNGTQGAVWVYTRGLTSGTFSQQGSKLVGTGNTGASAQGSSCSIYEDTIVSGGLNDNTGVGAIWVFTRSGTTWTQQGLKLVGSGNIASNQGQSCSIYKDTIVEGGHTDNNNQGAVWVFTRSNGYWTQQGPKLVGIGNVGPAQQGISCSVYEDTIVSGGWIDNTNQGAVWVFTRSGTVWSQLGSKFPGNSNRLGRSASIYKNIIVGGASADTSSAGAVFVFENNTTALAKWTGPAWDTNNVSPIRNFISTSITTDALNNVYCAGTYTNTAAITVYNLQNITSPFSLPQTDGTQTPSTIIKWSSTGTATGFTQLNFCSNIALAVDTQNNLYCSGYYNTSVVVPIMNFSTGSGTVSPFSLPISVSTDTFIIKWSSTGTAKSFNVLRGTGIDGTVTNITTDLNDSVYLASTYTSATPVALYNMSETTGALGTTQGSLAANVTAGSWTVTGSMNLTRSDYGSCLLNDGRVLVAGGITSASGSTAVSELYDPVTGTWSVTGLLPAAIQRSQCLLLQNNDVLIFSGNTNDAVPFTAPCATYNVASGSWTTVGSLNVPRIFCGSALLADGRVLIGGGQTAIASSATSSCELYNPLLKTWTTTGSLSAVRTQLTFQELPNGRILSIGGTTGGSGSTNVVEIYDPSTGLWTSASRILNPRRGMQGSCILQNSNVLVMGGSSVTNVSTNMATTGSCSYNYVTGLWSSVPNPVNVGLVGGFCNQLPNGLVLYGSGTQGTLSAACYLYNPVTATWAATGSMNSARFNNSQSSTLLKDGRVLVFGGYNASGTILSSAEVYTGADVTQAIVKWSSSGALERYQTYVGANNYSLMSNRSGLVVDPTGSINLFGSSGSQANIANTQTASTSGSVTNATRYTIDTLSAYSNVSQVPGSCVYSKWSVSGLVNIDPYAQDFNVQISAGTVKGLVKKIVTNTLNYSYKMNNIQLAQGYNNVYWNGSSWISVPNYNTRTISTFYLD